MLHTSGHGYGVRYLGAGSLLQQPLEICSGKGKHIFLRDWGLNLFTRIHHVGIHVHDLDKMLRFYQSAFGFEVVGEKFHFSSSPAVETITNTAGADVTGVMLKAGNTYVEVFRFNTPAPVSAEPKRPYDKGYTHFCVDTDDIEAAMLRLRDAGMDFKGREPVDCGTIKTLYGWDPEGNIIEIQQCMEGAETALQRLNPSDRC